MTRLRVGILGAGTIAQAEHIPNLVGLRDQFEVAGVVDPSATVRDFVAQTYDIPTFEAFDTLLDAKPLDAIVVALPDALHKDAVLAGLANGLHVFCEKPLCYSPGDIAEIAAARDRAGTVVQVGYMKRFDPAYRRALEMVPATADTLRMISVEVNDPDAWPFIAHHRTRRGEDVPRPLIEAARAMQKAQIGAAIGRPMTDLAFRGFAGAYSSSIVHDVNAVHGLLDAMHVEDEGEIVGADIFADGDGGYGAVSLAGGRVLWTMSHLTLPSLADYRERITLYFEDASLELEFPSPYLNHHPTRLTMRRSSGNVLSTTDCRAGFEEAFIEEMKGFWAAIVSGGPVVNPPEHAARDMKLLVRLTRHYLERHGRRARSAGLWTDSPDCR